MVKLTILISLHVYIYNVIPVESAFIDFIMLPNFKSQILNSERLKEWERRIIFDEIPAQYAKGNQISSGAQNFRGRKPWHQDKLAKKCTWYLMTVDFTVQGLNTDNFNKFLQSSSLSSLNNNIVIV